MLSSNLSSTSEDSGYLLIKTNRKFFKHFKEDLPNTLFGFFSKTLYSHSAWPDYSSLLLALQEGKISIFLPIAVQPADPQAPVVPNMDNTVYLLNHYPVDGVVCLVISIPWIAINSCYWALMWNKCKIPDMEWFTIFNHLPERLAETPGFAELGRVVQDAVDSVTSSIAMSPRNPSPTTASNITYITSRLSIGIAHLKFTMSIQSMIAQTFLTFSV